MIGKTLGHYEITSPLGKGGMGEVYVADDISLNRKVALKFLPEAFTGDPERMARFEREAKLLASLNHPNIAAIYGLEQAEGKRFIVMELVEGETLAQRLGKGALPIDESLGICKQIAEGLEAAHEKGVIHRDLKPANVMIAEGDKVKILDFGLAKALSGETQSADASQSPTITEAMTQPGIVLGTAAYMSPEQAKGKAVDRRADIWAFGCVLYECLTGKRAFEGETVTETLASILNREPEWESLPGATPPGIRFVLRRCLQKEMSQRFHHAADVRIELEETRQIGEAQVSEHRPWLWISTASVLALALGLSLWAPWRVRPTPPEPIRFQIDFPDKVRLGPMVNFAVSPDGRHLAFSAAGSDGISRVWIRSLNSPEIRPLPGTEEKNSSTLIWSPDSRFVAFQSGKKLKVVDIGGSAPRSICDISGAAVGGSWNRDGVIIFGDFLASNAIMRVSAAGGTASFLTKPNSERKETAHYSPTFLQDGRHFIYSCSSEISENTGAYIGSLDAGPEEQRPQKLMASSSVPMYVPSENSSLGHLLFLRDETLIAQPFDGKRLKLIGSAFTVAEQIGNYSNWGFFSASDGVLVYTSGHRQFFQLTWFDRQGIPLGTEGERGRFAGLALSPDGRRGAVSFDNFSNVSPTPFIWLLDFARHSYTPFTFRGWTLNPIWSPDGTRIIFTASEGVHDLYQKPANMIKNEEPVWKSEMQKSPTHWSRHLLLYSSTDPKTKDDLWVLPIEKGGKPTSIVHTEFNERYGRFSPNMHWIAYVSDETGVEEIWIRGFSQTGDAAPSVTSGKWQVSRGGGTEPRWREDGKELYYRAPEGRVMAVEVTAGKEFLVGTPKLLFQTSPVSSTILANIRLSSWDVTADGKRFFLPAPAVESSTPPINVVLNWQSHIKK